MSEAPVSFTVYPGDCDTFGHLNQAAFLVLFERARWQMLAEGPGMDLFEREGVWPAVRRAVIEYHGARLSRARAPLPASRDPPRPHQLHDAPGGPARIGRHAGRHAGVGVRLHRPQRARAVPVPAAVAALLLPTAPPAAAPQRRVAVHGVELALDDRGSGPALLFLHGYPFDGSLWRHQAGAFPGWRTLIPDLRGLVVPTRPTSATAWPPTRTTWRRCSTPSAWTTWCSPASRWAATSRSSFCAATGRACAALVLADTRAQADSAEGRKGREDGDGGRARGRRAAHRRADAAPAPGAKGAPELASRRGPGHDGRRPGRRESSARSPPCATGLTPRTSCRPSPGCPRWSWSARGSADAARRMPRGWRRRFRARGWRSFRDAGHLAPLEQPEAFNEHLRTLLAGSTESRRRPGETFWRRSGV